LLEELDLDGYYLFHSIRAELLRRVGRWSEARQAYDDAIALTDNSRERDFLARSRDALPLD
jgi:RNA polymerase sigma-70 factor (ECF subfamily)